MRLPSGLTSGSARSGFAKSTLRASSDASSRGAGFGAGGAAVAFGAALPNVAKTLVRFGGGVWADSPPHEEAKNEEAKKRSARPIGERRMTPFYP